MFGISLLPAASLTSHGLVCEALQKVLRSDLKRICFSYVVESDECLQNWQIYLIEDALAVIPGTLLCYLRQHVVHAHCNLSCCEHPRSRNKPIQFEDGSLNSLRALCPLLVTRWMCGRHGGPDCLDQ